MIAMHSSAPTRIGRLRQHRLRQRAFQHLRMDLDAGDHGVERRRLGIEQADRRGADQHQMPRDHAGRTVPSSTSDAET
jgi:hypothetical protein